LISCAQFHYVFPPSNCINLQFAFLSISFNSKS
jgi:hypothetical protein